MRTTGVMTVIACLIGVGITLWSPFDGDEESRSGAISADPADRVLQAQLGELAAAWNPRKKKRAIEAARAKLDLLKAPLLRLLEKPRHPRLGTAMFLSSELGVQEARPLLQELIKTAPRALRPEAVMAASALEPWSTDEARALLAHDDTGVRVATLLCIARNPDPNLFDDLLAKVVDDDPEIREAALAALPTSEQDPGKSATTHNTVTPKQRATVLELARGSTGPQLAGYMRALGRIGFDPASERFVTERLWDENESIRIAALRALSESSKALDEPRPVLELVSGDVSDREAALALYCLERTHSCQATDVRNRLGFLSAALPKFFAARILVQVGDMRGSTTLAEILDDSESTASGDDDTRAALRAATRTLLSSLYGKPLNHGAAEWRAFLVGAQPASARMLTPLTPEELAVLGL
ncbi:MAG: hypothetical protein H6832_13270 [Planctomycetes bacterium]|nr:hypothetical protein [Planctomycetota bacterium]MCB9892650.1 hypothetical protein [Planctomycetota bacterium]MCB9919367.1 hypothetical protein [Planctomycetota bacterium]